ncbi:MAG: hypothetical protein J1D77_09270 [Muribaculaceae bacterium]|nr:hypothetical protein [Muribaculaceae bacterium]
MNRRNRTITLGDKIFARVTRNGRTIFNYMTEKVATMSQLISELRIAMKDMEGLVMLHIRNYHQGWGEERPLMLYAEKNRNMDSFRNFVADMPARSYVKRVERQMMFPWETH